MGMIASGTTVRSGTLFIETTTGIVYTLNEEGNFVSATGDTLNYVNDDVDVPLIYSSDEPNAPQRGKTWLTFNEEGRPIISVYDGQSWSRIGEEFEPIDIGLY